MAIFNLNYYTEEDYYSDGDIENELLELVKSGESLSDLKQASYPIVYHLSPVRENILNWYPFDSEGTILEIGSGCGAITGMLCSKVKQVVSVELSKRRASINYERNLDKENLTIYVGNLNDMEFGQTFDYIILNGVFEYAISFTDTENPYADFLTNIKKHLSEQGKLIIAIENKYGLKYFAGAPEDHTNEYFLGLNDYEGNRSVRTFGKQELTELLNMVGFSYLKFYYPYPDYKFPNEIFTDDTLQTNGYGRDYYNLNGDRYLLYNEQGVAKGLAKEGVASTFANSFLVIASAEQLQELEETLYVKINNDRNNEFRILTKIVWNEEQKKKYVYKLPITAIAKKHIMRMIEESKIGQRNLKPVPSISCDVFQYVYLEHNTLDNEIKQCIDHKELDIILDMLDKFFNVAFTNSNICRYDTEEFQKVFGMEMIEEEVACVTNANIDLICDNVFHIGECYYVIDSEWVFPFPIPVEFIKWRVLNELFNKHSQLLKLMPVEDYLQRFDIGMEHCELFQSWNYHFSKVYVGSDSLEQYSIQKEVFDLNAVLDHTLAFTKARSFLYYDDGTGFSEDKKLCSVLRTKGTEFQVRFNLPKLERIIRLRWDPTENRLLQFKIQQIDSDVAIKHVAENAMQSEDGWDTFLTLDPRYQLIIDDKNVSYIDIKGNIRELNDDANLQKEIDAFVLRERQEDIRIHQEDLKKHQLYEEKIETLELKENYIPILKNEWSIIEEELDKSEKKCKSMELFIRKLNKELGEKEKIIEHKEKVIRQLLSLNEQLLSNSNEMNSI